MENNHIVNQKKVCFIALGAYPLLYGLEPKNVIGPDVHQFIIASELVKRSFDVSMITYGSPINLSVRSATITAITMPEIPLDDRLFSRSKKILNFVRAFIHSDSEIYYHRASIPGIVAIFCRLRGKKFVYGIASDALVNKDVIIKKNQEFAKNRTSVNNIGNFIDIYLADSIVVQSKYQQEQLKKNFGKSGTVIKNPLAITEEKPQKNHNPPTILWVGSMAEVKQPDIFVDIAEQIPSVKFQMVGGYAGDRDLYDKIRQKAAGINNFEFVGPVPFDTINQYFANASLLVNTSIFEGFPNAFLQAWMNYTPVISLNADPDEIICQKQLGFHSKTINQMVEDIKMCLNNPELMKEFGINGRRYVEKEHNIDNIISQYEGIFLSLMKRLSQN